MVYNKIKETTGFVYGYNEISHIKTENSFLSLSGDYIIIKNEQWYLNL